jgi:CRP-like cAMP-binding protein
MSAVSPLLDALDEPTRREVMTAARRRRFAAREVVFHEGDPGDSMHIVCQGHLSVRITTPLGEVATIRIVRPGEFFGELALLAPGPRNATVVAMDRVETLSITRNVLQELRTSQPAFEAMIIEALARELRRCSDALAEALYLPADKRVLRRLLDLAAAFGDARPVDRVPATQEEIAQLAGVTRETANRVLKRAADDGAIALARGRIDILDHERVARLAH